MAEDTSIFERLAAFMDRHLGGIGAEHPTRKRSNDHTGGGDTVFAASDGGSGYEDSGGECGDSGGGDSGGGGDCGSGGDGGGGGD